MSESSHKAVGIDRDDAANSIKRSGGRWCMSKLSPRGWPKAVAVDFVRLSNSPSTWKDSSVLPGMTRYDHLTKDKFVRLLETRASRHFSSRVISGSFQRLNRLNA